MKKNSTKDAKHALAEIDFPLFFKLIVKITNAYEQQQLAEEAISVAKQQHNIDTLKQLSSLSIQAASSIYPKLIFALVELDALDTAIALVVLNEHEIVETQGWCFLAFALLKRKDFEKVGKIYKYLKIPYEQAEITCECLANIPLPGYILDWLEWLDRYIQLKQLGNNDFLQRGVRALIITDKETFKAACLKLQQVTNSPLKTKLLIELYLELALKNDLIKHKMLFASLPEELAWLINIPKLLEGDEKQIAILDKIPNTYPHTFASKIFHTAIKKILSKIIAYNDNHLSEEILNIAGLTEKYRGLFISDACKVLLKHKRLDAFIILIPHISDFLHEGAINLLLEHQLTDEQYQIIVTHLEKLESTSPYMTLTQILEKIPDEFIIAERARRAADAAAKVHQDYAKLNKINRRHSQYNELTTCLTKLLKLKDLKTAFILCKKLVPSKNRDFYVMTLLHHALTDNEYELANRVIGLFNDTQTCAILQSFLAHYQKQNYRTAFKKLAKLKESGKFIELLAECVGHILQEKNIASGINFLLDNGVFGLGGYVYFDLSVHKFGNCDTHNEAHNIKTRVVLAMLAHYKKSSKMRGILTSMRKREVKSYAPYLLAGLLKNGRLVCAVELLSHKIKTNAITEIKDLPKCLKELTEEYLVAKDPQVSDIQALAALDVERLRHAFIRKLLNNIFVGFREDQFKLILAITDAKLRDYYLEHIIINCVCNGEIPMALQACNSLPKTGRKPWAKIIAHASSDNFIAIIDLLIEKAVEIDELLIWAVNSWLRGKEPVVLLKMLKHYLARLTKLLQQRPDVDAKIEIEEFNQFYRRERIYEDLFSRIFHGWQQTLSSRKSYKTIITDLRDLLKIPGKSTTSYNVKYDLHGAVRNVISSLLNECADHPRFYNLLFNAIKLILTYENSYPQFLIDKVLNTLLERTELDYACELLSLVDNDNSANSYWREKARLKVCSGFINKSHYTRAFKLLLTHKGDGLTHMTCREVNKWAIDLINNGKLKQALKFINKFLDDNNQNEFQLIVEAMLTKGYIIPARKFITEKIDSPAVKISLQKKLQRAYHKKLCNYMGRERTDALFLSYQNLQKFFKLVKTNNQKPANLCKNTLIVELRGQLDKAFLAFYRQHYDNPSQRGGRPLGVYFPVVPDLQNRTVRERLEEYFTNMLRISDFSSDFPKQFNFLLAIQPLSNTNYIWLKQLYKLANVHKHDHDVLSTPNVDNVNIDMKVFLPKILDGVTELLLRLFNPDMDASELRFSDYVKFNIMNAPISLSHSSLVLFSNNSNIRSATRAPGGQQAQNTLI